MKKFKSIFIAIIAVYATVMMSSCTRIDAACEGIKVNLYGSDKGVDDVVLVSGMVWFNPLTEEVYEYPTYVQMVDYEPFEIDAKGGGKFTIDPTININPIYGKSAAIFKKYRKSHCKGCLNEFMPCSACAVLDCWLRKTYLPEGEWEKASQYDIHTKLLKDITDDIDKRILEELKKEFKK